MCVVMLFSQETFTWAEENIDSEIIFYDSEITSKDDCFDEVDSSVEYVPSDIQGGRNIVGKHRRLSDY